MEQTAGGVVVVPVAITVIDGSSGVERGVCVFGCERGKRTPEQKKLNERENKSDNKQQCENQNKGIRHSYDTTRSHDVTKIDR